MRVVAVTGRSLGGVLPQLQRPRARVVEARCLIRDGLLTVDNFQGFPQKLHGVVPVRLSGGARVVRVIERERVRRRQFHWYRVTTHKVGSRRCVKRFAQVHEDVASGSVEEPAAPHSAFANLGARVKSFLADPDDFLNGIVWQKVCVSACPVSELIKASLRPVSSQVKRVQGFVVPGDWHSHVVSVSGKTDRDRGSKCKSR